MKKIVLLAVSALFTHVWADGTGWSFNEVTATQRWPWSRKVDIDFRATQTDDAVSRLRAARVSVRMDGVLLDASQLTGTSILGEGRHHIVWTPTEDGSLPREIKDATFTISLESDVKEVGYMTVDVVSGAVDYQPLSFSNDVNSATYKTTLMAFRYIPSTQAGEWRVPMGKTTFQIGSDGTRTDIGINATDRAREGVADVTLTKGFFIGVFPMTRKQYALLGGDASGNDMVAMRGLSYNGLRGADGVAGSYCFPTSRKIDMNKPIGRLRQRTGLSFDFPTEAQWEYAARAGSEGEYLFPESASMSSADRDALLRRYGAYDMNAVVGSKSPNAWGLYDLIGCCHQWTTTCSRKTAADSDAKHANATDPLGVTTQMDEAPYRVCKGSHWDIGDVTTRARVARMAYRYPLQADGHTERINSGCRLALTLEIK